MKIIIKMIWKIMNNDIRNKKKKNEIIMIIIIRK